MMWSRDSVEYLMVESQDSIAVIERGDMTSQVFSMSGCTLHTSSLLSALLGGPKSWKVAAYGANYEDKNSLGRYSI